MTLKDRIREHEHAEFCMRTHPVRESYFPWGLFELFLGKHRWHATAPEVTFDNLCGGPVACTESTRCYKHKGAR